MRTLSLSLFELHRQCDSAHRARTEVERLRAVVAEASLFRRGYYVERAGGRRKKNVWRDKSLGETRDNGDDVGR